ncbi:protein mesh-like isoform X1 [Mytilus californianus]|uniref:protein mesh-like isoform X1 n=1 Tax=Mytilus californianus TaxID=6549 RepID=UPI00224515C0|nr:protein mesh-like isoform X1 [Mytilus californianus]
MKIFDIVLLFLLSFDNTYCISTTDFYSFGSENGDTNAPTNDDGSTAPIPVSSLFPFFNHQHDSLIVNTNGVISFLGTMSSYTPTPFPLGSSRRLVAPYWADMDTRNGGDIWYRETTNSTLLQKASVEIQTIFPRQYNFKASWMFIGTWKEVAFFGADSNGKQKRNTFQCVLITNGRHSFVMFLYDKIEWTTGTASGGSSSTGLGGTPAQVGFDAGDGINYFAVNASRTADIINIPRMSNVDIPGKYIFRVDSTTIEQGGCNVNGTLTITPREALMFGGTRLIVSGPCFNLAKNIKFYMSDNTEVSCHLLTDISISCISPMVYRSGKYRVSLHVQQFSQTVTKFPGTLTIVNPAIARQVLKREPKLWKYNSLVSVYWNPTVLNFPSDEVISLHLYTITKENLIYPVLTYHSKISALNSTVFANGRHTFNLQFSNDAGIIKMSTNNPKSPYYWSDMFTVNVNRQQSQTSCYEWWSKDLNQQTINSKDVNPCPCTLDVANIDSARFSVDPQCYKIEGSEFFCQFQTHAKVCYRLNIPSRSYGYDHQCCYDKTGVLMNPNGDSTDGSGYVNRYHFQGSNDANVPFLSNFVYDVVPYMHCCMFPFQDFEPDEMDIARKQCSLFFNRRPPNSCMNYIPPRPARVTGDPHFVTFDGQAYTFNPVGEFSALSNGNFSLQLRMEQYSNARASSVTSFVAQPYPTADVIEVQPNTIRGIDVLVNGELVDFNSSESMSASVISAEGSTIVKTSDSPPTIIATFYTEDISIKASSAMNLLNLVIMTSPDRHTGNLSGLFGDNDGDAGNDLHSKDNELTQGNASMVAIHNNFGLSWRAAENESLFTYTGGRTYESYQNLNFIPTFDIPDNIDPTITHLCNSNSDCIYDYYVTGNPIFAEMSANASDDFARISNYTIPVATCGFPSNVSDAVWVADGYTEGSSARLLCNRNFFQVDVVITCTPSGNWSDFNVTCMSLPECGKPQLVANGYWVPVEGTDGRKATLQCKDGYYMPIEKVRIICSLNGTWTYVEVKCNIVTTSSSSTVSTLEHITSNRNTFISQTNNTEPQTITTEQATIIKASTVEQSSTTNATITTDGTSFSNDGLVTSTAEKVSTSYQHGEIDSTRSVSTSIYISTIKQDKQESTTIFQRRRSTTETTESSTTSSIKEPKPEMTSDASRPFAPYKYNTFTILTLTACIVVIIKTIMYY